MESAKLDPPQVTAFITPILLASISMELTEMSGAAATPATDFDPAWDEPRELERFTRWSHNEAGQRRADSLLVVEGMDCAACSVAVEAALNGLSGVESADVNPATGRARVRWDPARTSASRLAQAVQAAGYRAWPGPPMAAEAEASTRLIASHCGACSSPASA